MTTPTSVPLSEMVQHSIKALTKPSVKMERPDGEIVKITFSSITEIINHNPDL